MCGSDFSVKGGMVSVVNNYLSYENWNEYEIIYIPTHIYGSKIKKAIFFLKNYMKIVKGCIRKEYQIAHLHVSERGSFYRKALIFRTLKRLGIKTIFHHHAAEFESFYNSLSDKKKCYVSKILNDVDLNLVLSDRLVSSITTKAPNAKVEVLHNAVNTYSKNRYNVNGKNVLFLGLLGKRKGTYDFLDAIARIDNDLPKEIKFCLCGNGEIELIKQRVSELRIENRIAHIGWINKEKKEDFFSKSILNVLPSYNEGLPMTILETMAYGIPNISTSIASIPEVIFEGKNGFLISPGDTEKLARCIIELINNVELRMEFSKQSYEMINNKFSLDNNILILKKIYRRFECV